MSAVDVAELIREGNTRALTEWLADTRAIEIAEEIGHLDSSDTAFAFRLLPRDRAIEVFEALDPIDQQQVLDGLRDDRVRHLIEELDPDDRVKLLDEMPAKVAHRLLSQLSADERALTTLLLGYPEDSTGRAMSPEFVSLRASMTAEQAIAKIQREGLDAETVYALPVVDNERHLIGVTGLRAVVLARSDTLVGDLMTTDVHFARTDADQEVSARLVAEAGLIALPVVDSEHRLVGVLTVDDAMRILEEEVTEDLALHGGHSPLAKPYLQVGAMRLARVRAMWLLILILAAGLTVNVLQFFEGSIAKVLELALFVPLLTGTGGNSGAQASTAVIRALAVGEVRFRDLPRIAWREARVGVMLGAMLGAAAFGPVALIWYPRLGLVIAVALLAICTWATIAGSCLPLIAQRLGIDPAVVSAPVITTVVDATGLIIYFVFAAIILGI